MALPLSIYPTIEGAAADAAPILPFGCMTGASKDVLRHIQQGALSAKARYFLTMIAIASFGNAGWQKQQHLPDPGLWCSFELSVWAREHGWSRQYTWRIREQVVALGILRYEPDLADARKGTLHWNLTFSEWKALDDTYRRQRYARPRPTSASAETADHHDQEADPSSNCIQPQEASNGRHAAGTSNGLQQFEGSNGLQKRSKRLQQSVKHVTSAGAEAVFHQAPTLALRKEEREERVTETTTVVSDAASASSLRIFGPGTSEAAASTAAAALSAPASAGAEAAFCWPLRQEYEKTDLDFYQRVVRERESQRVALLTRLAHERIGVALVTTGYARIGALAKQCGAALLVKHILLAAANHIDGDPLDYLTRLVHSSQAGHPRKKEASYGSALNTSSNNSNDRPKRFGWEGWDVATAR